MVDVDPEPAGPIDTVESAALLPSQSHCAWFTAPPRPMSASL